MFLNGFENNFSSVPAEADLRALEPRRLLPLPLVDTVSAEAEVSVAREVDGILSANSLARLRLCGAGEASISS